MIAKCMYDLRYNPGSGKDTQTWQGKKNQNLSRIVYKKEKPQAISHVNIHAKFIEKSNSAIKKVLSF